MVFSWKTCQWERDRLDFNQIRDHIISRLVRIKKVTMLDSTFIGTDLGEYEKLGGEDEKAGRSSDGESASRNLKYH